MDPLLKFPHPNATRWPNYYSILQVRKLRPGRGLYQIRTWAGWFFPLIGAAPSSCGQGACFREAGREVVMSEGGQGNSGWWLREESLMIQAEK